VNCFVLRDDLLRVYFETANASRRLENGRETTLEKRATPNEGTAKSRYFTKDLRDARYWQAFCSSFTSIERSNAFPD
jgi:hypothetical protein